MLAPALTGASVITGASLFRPRAAQAQDAEPVDVALILAVDISRSVDDEEARLQREGYRNAMTDPKVVAAVRAGMLGAIAVAYVEWAGAEYQKLVLPWTRIAAQADADRWASALEEAPRESLSWTSISGAILFARQVMAAVPFEATRRVIDISGDGVNNSGSPVEQARDAAVADGITINGLAIINDKPMFGRPSNMPLDEYYQQNVVGGPGAFVVVAEDFASFGEAVRRKIIREVAALPMTQPPISGPMPRAG